MAAEVATPLWLYQHQRSVTGSAEIAQRGTHLFAAFDAAAIETLEYDFYLALNYQSGSNVTATITGVAASATSGNARLRLAFEYVSAGGTDVDADSFATAVEVNATADATSGESFTGVFTLSNSNLDSAIAGSWMRMQLSRVGNDGTNDTMTGDFQAKLGTFSQ